MDAQMRERLARLMAADHGSDLTPEEAERRNAERYNRAVGRLNEEDGYNCNVCKNKGYVATVYRNEQFGYYTTALVPCKCQRVRKALGRLARSGLKNTVKAYSFDRYEIPNEWQAKLKSRAMQFCKDQEHGWWFMGGQSGCGKTHLCTAITVHFIRDGRDTRYMPWRDSSAKIKAVANDGDAYAQLMHGLKTVPVLYIDDLFKGGRDRDGKPAPPTEADIKIAFEIINYRYNNPDLVTIISSEKSIAQIGAIDEAIAGRIAERAKAGGYCFNIKRDPARNWRMKGIEEV